MPIFTIKDLLYCHTDDGKYDSYDGHWNRRRKQYLIPDAGWFRTVRTVVTTSNGDNQHEVIPVRRPGDSKIIAIDLEIRVEPHRPFGANHWCGVAVEIDVDMPMMIAGGGGGDSPSPFEEKDRADEPTLTALDTEAPSIQEGWTCRITARIPSSGPGVGVIEVGTVDFTPAIGFEMREGDEVHLSFPPHHINFRGTIMRRVFDVVAKRVELVVDRMSA